MVYSRRHLSAPNRKEGLALNKRLPVVAWKTSKRKGTIITKANASLFQIELLGTGKECY